MKTLVRAVALAILLAPFRAATSHAAPAAADTTALQFHDFRAGARLDEIQRRRPPIRWGQPAV